MNSVTKFVERYSFGKFYVFDGNNKCIVLSEKRFDDYVGVIRVDDSFKLSMYEGTTKLNFSKSKIQNIIERIDTKIYQPLICSFVLSTTEISNIKEQTKLFTHIEFGTSDNQIVLRFFDYRDLIEGENTIQTLTLGKTSKNSFRKIINCFTFNKFCKQQDYIVNISYGDFIEFESMNDSYSLIFQEQLNQ